MKIRKNAPIENEGVNYVKTIFEHKECLFHELQLKNDYGIDAIVEIPIHKELMGNLIALQIKSGSSFCTEDSCFIPADRNHFEYWWNYSLPVIGIVYDPDEKTGYWKDIKKFIKSRPQIIEKGPYRITFSKRFNQFDNENFHTFAYHLDSISNALDFDLSMMYVKSNDSEKCSVGMSSLLNDHLQNIKTWNFLFDKFHSSKIGMLDPSIVYAFSHISYNPDIFLTDKTHITGKLQKILQNRISKFTKDDVVKLFSVIEDDDSFQRGDMSEFVYFTLQPIPNIDKMLKKIISDTSLTTQIRLAALYFFADHKEKEILPFLSKLIENKNGLEDTVQFVYDMIKEHGYWLLY